MHALARIPSVRSSLRMVPAIYGEFFVFCLPPSFYLPHTFHLPRLLRLYRPLPARQILIALERQRIFNSQNADKLLPPRSTGSRNFA